VSPYC